jgi:GNAT superfamily N-acetyltransferase
MGISKGEANPGIRLRDMRWPEDRAAILGLEISFTTSRVYRVVTGPGSFGMQEDSVTPPLHKVYDLTAEVDQFPTFDHVLIAELEGQTAGVAALAYEAENRRAIVKHIYVDRARRGQGVGGALMREMLRRAGEWPARYVWLETQDVNYEAIQFYQRMGFRWCGLDLSLDEHDGSARDETAVFFMIRPSPRPSP